MIAVVDASVALGTILGVPDAVERFAAVEEAHAPQLLVLETINALRGLRRSGAVEAEAAEIGIQLLHELPVTLWDHRPTIDAVWARRDELTAYDAAYLVTAEALGAHLVTADRGLARRGRAALGRERVVHVT